MHQGWDESVMPSPKHCCARLLHSQPEGPLHQRSEEIQSGWRASGWTPKPGASHAYVANANGLGTVAQATDYWSTG